MALTLILAGPSSSASVLVRPVMANFDVAYGSLSGKPMRPAVDEMLTMAPRPAARIRGTARRAQ